MSYPPPTPPPGGQYDPNAGTPAGWQQDPNPGTPPPPQWQGAAQQMAPGWYPDPMQAGHQRQWDGQEWVGPSVPTGGKKKGGFPKWAIPVIACLGLAFIAVVIAALAGGSDDDTADRTSTEASTTTETDEPSTTEADEEEPEPEEPSTTEEPTTTAPTTTTTTAPPAPDGSADRPLPSGGTTRVGDYEVTASITLDAAGQVQAENQFNEPPSNGAYAIVDLNVTYVGNEEGTPGFDLSVVMQGGNGVQYKDSECGASLSPGPYEAPTLTNGGSTPVRFCLNYAPEAVDGGALFVEPLISFGDDERRYWALG